ncbi:hypothetical protein OK016_29090 [Vibrio chagasii]|nr:hypothetical protein [Vibrio chagasii]
MEFPVVNDPEQALIAEFKPIGMPALYYIYQGKVIKDSLWRNQPHWRRHY